MKEIQLRKEKIRAIKEITINGAYYYLGQEIGNHKVGFINSQSGNVELYEYIGKRDGNYILVSDSKILEMYSNGSHDSADSEILIKMSDVEITVRLLEEELLDVPEVEGKSDIVN